MGLGEAYTDGTCSKCGEKYKKGDKIAFQKGSKDKLCAKCAPKDVGKRPFVPSRLDLHTEVALEAFKGILARHPALKAQELNQLSWKAADGFMAERAQRGIK